MQLDFLCLDQIKFTWLNPEFSLSCSYLSTNLNKKIKYPFSKKEKEELTISELQKEVLVGTLLGDASLERNKLTHNTRLRFDQTFPNHASYLMNLYIVFNKLSARGPKVYTRKPDVRTNKIYSSIQYKTLNLPCLNHFYDLFYKNGKKRIPTNLIDIITSRSLAYWIMDDGSKVSKNTILHTRSYQYNEILLLQEILYTKFKLYTTKHEKVPGQWVIVIPYKQETSLRKIVLSYMHYTMLYKI